MPSHLDAPPGRCGPRSLALPRRPGIERLRALLTCLRLRHPRPGSRSRRRGPGRGRGGAGDRGGPGPQVRGEMTMMGRGDGGAPRLGCAQPGPRARCWALCPPEPAGRLRSPPSSCSPVPLFLKGPRRPAAGGGRARRKGQQCRRRGARAGAGVDPGLGGGVAAKGRLEDCEDRRAEVAQRGQYPGLQTRRWWCAYRGWGWALGADAIPLKRL